MKEDSLQCLEADMLPVLVMAFPKAFFPIGRSCRPLRAGIFEDLNAALPPEIDRLRLSHYLGIYTRQPRYLRELTRGAARIDLNGKPAGRVSANEAASAAARIQELHLKPQRPAPVASFSTSARLTAPPTVTTPGQVAFSPARTLALPSRSQKSAAQKAHQKVIVVLKRKKPFPKNAYQDSKESRHL
jgi:ProP effector